MAVRALVEKAISRLKGEAYALDANLSAFSLIGLTFERGLSAARGLWIRIRVQGKGIIFAGRGVRVRRCGRAAFGRGVTLQDNVRIDGLCKGKFSIGNNVTIGRGTTVESYGVIRNLGESLVIGDNVGIGAYSHIGMRGPIEIGENTIMGPYVSFHAENHIFEDPNTLIRLQGESRKGITVGKDCWIGAKATILDGVRIGDGCVVAAGAVVIADVPPYCVVGGVPAKVIKRRDCESAT